METRRGTRARETVHPSIRAQGRLPSVGRTLGSRVWRSVPINATDSFFPGVTTRAGKAVEYRWEKCTSLVVPKASTVSFAFSYSRGVDVTAAETLEGHWDVSWTGTYKSGKVTDALAKWEFSLTVSGGGSIENMTSVTSSNLTTTDWEVDVITLIDDVDVVPWVLNLLAGGDTYQGGLRIVFNHGENPGSDPGYRPAEDNEVRPLIGNLTPATP